MLEPESGAPCDTVLKTAFGVVCTADESEPDCIPGCVDVVAYHHHGVELVDLLPQQVVEGVFVEIVVEPSDAASDGGR